MTTKKNMFLRVENVPQSDIKPKRQSQNYFIFAEACMAYGCQAYTLLTVRLTDSNHAPLNRAPQEDKGPSIILLMLKGYDFFHVSSSIFK